MNETVKKVPLLGDIPIVGHLFRRTVNDKSKTELLIFLTPYVAKEPEELTAISEAERAQEQSEHGRAGSGTLQEPHGRHAEHEDSRRLRRTRQQIKDKGTFSFSGRICPPGSRRGESRMSVSGSRGLDAAPVAGGVVLGREPFGVAVEEQIVAALVAMPIGGDPSGEIVADGLLCRRGHVGRGPHVQQVEYGRDVEVFADRGSPAARARLIVGQVDPLGGSLNPAAAWSARPSAALVAGR